jgi:hypothetical protein
MFWRERAVVSAWFYDLGAAFLYPIIAVLIAGSGELGNLIGYRLRKPHIEGGDIGTLTGAALGLLALLLAFSFSIALSRYDARRDMVLEEANAIGSTANFVLMLPDTSKRPILSLLRDYTAIRVGLGVPFDPAKMERDVAQSLVLQSQLWQQAVAMTQAAPQSLPAYRFVASLNEMNNIHERRLTVLRNHVPAEVMLMLIGVSMVAMGFTGYHAGIAGAQRRVINLIMSAMVAVLIMLVVDLDRPSRGLIVVPVQPLIDAAQTIPP